MKDTLETENNPRFIVAEPHLSFLDQFASRFKDVTLFCEVYIYKTSAFYYNPNLKYLG